MTGVDAPWFEDFKVGDDFSDVPSVTLTEAHNVVHQALFGDRLRMPIDHPLCQRVTGSHHALVNPSMVCNMAIGLSTMPSQRVMGNLFYRGLVLRAPVFVGDTLTTSTRVVALRQNKAREGRAATGMVALEIHVTNQSGKTVLLFWRCPMIACRNAAAVTNHADDFSFMPETITDSDLRAVIPGWDLAPLSETQKPNQLVTGEAFKVEARDTVTLAPELVRLTLNMAMTHTDASRSIYGKRLVYGGHTISMAAAQLSRAVPGLATVLGWFHCDHVAPVFEQDILQSIVTLESHFAIDGGCVAVFHVETFCERGAEAPEAGTDIKVLDWRVAALVAGSLEVL